SHYASMAKSSEITAADLRVEIVAQAEVPAIAGLCARTMRDNPLHVRVFGADDGRRQQCLQRFFSPTMAYVQRRGYLYGAYAKTELVGVLGLLPPGRCRPRLTDVAPLLGILRATHSPTEIQRIGRWLWAWRWHDPATPHWHLGPFAIAPRYQGRHVGRHLIAAVADRHETGAADAWLETDKHRNVRLYAAYGFRVVGTAHILGVKNWFMRGTLAASPKRRHACY